MTFETHCVLTVDKENMKRNKGTYRHPHIYQLTFYIFPHPRGGEKRKKVLSDVLLETFFPKEVWTKIYAWSEYVFIFCPGGSKHILQELILKSDSPKKFGSC